MEISPSDVHSGSPLERRSPEELRRLLDRAVAASSNGIVITDPRLPDNPIVYVNPAFEKTTGYAMGEVLGLNCRFLQGEDRDQPPLEELRAAVREGRECRVILRNYRKDGARFWNELSVYPVRDEEGKLTNFVGVQNDVTERRRAEQELSEMRRAERRRIARDLHDIVLQDLSGALQSLRLSHLQARRSGGGPEFEEELEALGRATSGLRSAIYDLRHERGRPFVASVESLVELNRQADPGFRRTGIGLSAMRERAEGLGGVIEVSGRPGEGTRVRVEVPLRDDNPAPRRL